MVILIMMTIIYIYIHIKNIYIYIYTCVYIYVLFFNKWGICIMRIILIIDCLVLAYARAMTLCGGRGAAGGRRAARGRRGPQRGLVGGRRGPSTWGRAWARPRPMAWAQAINRQSIQLTPPNSNRAYIYIIDSCQQSIHIFPRTNRKQEPNYVGVTKLELRLALKNRSGSNALQQICSN